MRTIEFAILGSKGDTYTLLFRQNGANLNAYCDCPAGQNALYCKHRFALMGGDVTNLVSKNEEDVRELQRMLVGTDLEKAYEAVCAAEEAYDIAKRNLSRAKTALTKAMYR